VPHAVAVAAGTADVAAVAANPNLKLIGVAIAETASSAAAAEVAIRHGTAATDPFLVPNVNLDANGFGIEWFGHGVSCANGIYVDRIAGNTTLVLYIDPISAVP